jgi:hypothetical protein
MKARHQERAQRIDRDNALPPVGIGLEKLHPPVFVVGSGRHAHARAVDQNIDGTECGQHLVDGAPAIFGA